MAEGGWIALFSSTSRSAELLWVAAGYVCLRTRYLVPGMIQQRYSPQELSFAVRIILPGVRTHRYR